jgi:hypothetical protein
MIRLTYYRLIDRGNFEIPFTMMDADKVKSFPSWAKSRFGKGRRHLGVDRHMFYWKIRLNLNEFNIFFR